MSLVHLVFVAVSITGLSYFLICLRQFDFFSIAFLSACVYFLPGFFGYTIAPVSVGRLVPVDLESDTYVVMIVVMLAILVGAFLFDHVIPARTFTWRLQRSEGAVLYAVLFAVIGYFMLVITLREALLDEDKIALMEKLNRWHVLGATAAPLAAVLSFGSRRWLLLTLSICLLVFDMYMGFRVSFGIALIAIFTLGLSRFGPQRMALQNWKIGFIAIICICILFVYKQLYIAVKLGMWDHILDRLVDFELYSSAVMLSEPFNTQSILNEVMAQKFQVGMGHFSDVFLQVLLFSADLGSAPVSFNDLFQSTLFPSDLDYGMANNIWAEMWSSGGWPLLGLFLIIFVSLLMVGSYLLRCHSASLAGGAALAFSYWAFYIHRNDLLNQVNLEKRAILLWVGCVLLSECSRIAHGRSGEGGPMRHPSENIMQ
jgi:hypothetical protein